MLLTMDVSEQALQLLEQLSSHETQDGIESAYVGKTIEFLRSSRHPFSRNTPSGHVTVSAVLVDSSREHVLLLWHKKLERWLQPGGHCEPEVDQTLVHAALRELEEETSVNRSQLDDIPSRPFDIDVHEIPAKASEAAHLHYDLRFLFKQSPHSLLRVILDAKESGGYEWRRLAELCTSEDSSVSRFAQKVAARSALR
jgi:ADP-ribose pyrophosphatase YjhB (NUDIX family)